MSVVRFSFTRRIVATLSVFAIAASATPGCGALQAQPGASVGDMPSQGPVGRTMGRHAHEFAACGRDSVSIQTGSAQRMRLSFMIDAEGRVSSPDVEQMTSPDPDLYNCVRRVLRRLNFPKPKDGKPKRVVYPLVLRPK